MPETQIDAKKPASTVDGVRAIELRYMAIRDIDSSSVYSYRSKMRLNSSKLGVLKEQDFWNVAVRTGKDERIFELALIQVINAAKRFLERGVDFRWLSVKIPPSYLNRTDCTKKIADVTSEMNIPRERICFEIASLESLTQKALENLEALRTQGFHLLAELKLQDSLALSRTASDFVILPPDICGAANYRERAVLGNIIAMINELEAEPIAYGEFSTEQLETIRTFDCLYHTGEGKFLAERYVRRSHEDNDEQNDEQNAEN